MALAGEQITAAVTVTLPDGSERRFDRPVTGAELAADIGPGLAKAALAIRVDGEIRDLAHVIDGDAAVSIVTLKDDDALELIRHDAAHVLAEAVQELWPGTQITFGPATEDGFYYDFHRNEPFSPEDFEAIEAKMAEIVERDEKITRHIWDRADAVAHFEQAGEQFKAEWVGELPDDEDISIYTQGEWLDLCTGPHLPSTGKLPRAFKLMKVAGAYWRGDPNNPQLQRIYGTAWRDPEGAQGLSDAPGGGREARPPPPRPGNGPCSISSGRPSAASSGTPRGGRSTASPSAICARASTRPDMWGSRRPS